MPSFELGSARTQGFGEFGTHLVRVILGVVIQQGELGEGLTGITELAASFVVEIERPHGLWVKDHDGFG